MNHEIDTPTWRNKVNLVIVSMGIVFLPLMAHAGGLGIAPLAAIVGSVGILTTPFSDFLKRPPNWLIGLFIFMLWAVTTSFWSSYEDTQTLTNPLKWAIGVPLFLGCFLAVESAIKYHKIFLSHLLMAACVLGVGLLLIDLLSGYALTHVVDPPKANEDIIKKQGDARMNLGHAITVWLLLIVPTSILMVRNFRYGKIYTALLILGLFGASILNMLAVGILGLVMLGFVYFLGRKSPKTTLSGLIYGSIGSVILMPVIGVILRRIPKPLIEKLPLSWFHRVEMWSYTTDKITETPLWGHGFDAARTFKGDEHKFEILEGLYWHYITLHPHNFGLHLWLETGLIGAILAGVFIFFIKKPLLALTGRKFRILSILSFITAAFLICNTTYGVWQDWWWATMIFCASLLQIISLDEDNLL